MRDLKMTLTKADKDHAIVSAWKGGVPFEAIASMYEMTVDELEKYLQGLGYCVRCAG